MRKVANKHTDRQTNKQTNNDESISSLAEVNIYEDDGDDGDAGGYGRGY